MRDNEDLDLDASCLQIAKRERKILKIDAKRLDFLSNLSHSRHFRMYPGIQNLFPPYCCKIPQS